MTEPAGSKPRTWRPITLWTAGILLALGLAWFVGEVAVPVWQADRTVAQYDDLKRHASYPWQGLRQSIEDLGGEAAAARKLGLYLRMPGWAAGHKVVALEVLTHCGKPALPAFRDALGSRDDGVRGAAVFYLPELCGGDAGLEAAVAPMVAAMAKDPAVLVRLMTIGGLGALAGNGEHPIEPPDPEVLRTLLALLFDTDAGVRWRAAETLTAPEGAIPYEIALKNARYCLRTNDEERKEQAGNAAQRAIPVLEQLAGSQNREVRAVAAEALKKIRGEEVARP